MENNVSVSTIIKKPAEDIKKHITDLRGWEKWSPFKTADPKAAYTYFEEEKGLPQKMAWDGKVNGKGTMTLVKVATNDIFFHLEFLTPFKSKAKVQFSLKEINKENTEVHWSMKGYLPFFLFFLKKFFNKMLNNDFKRGLKRLKKLSEQGGINAEIIYDDEPKEHSSIKVLLKKSSNVHINNLAKVMSKDMSELWEVTQKEKLGIVGGYCFYDKVDFMKDLFSFRSGYQIKGETNKVDLTTIPEHRAIKVTVKGAYEYLEDAWAGGMMHLRAHKLKMSKKVPSYEKYLVGPFETKNSDEYITEIIIPIK